MRHRRRVGIVLFCTFAILGILFVIWLWSVAVRGQEFEADSWRTDLEAKDGTRLGMAHRLIWDRALIGKTRSEVIAMLGEPQPPGALGPNHLVYWLAIRGHQSEWLVVRLDADGRVAESRIDRER